MTREFLRRTTTALSVLVTCLLLMVGTAAADPSNHETYGNAFVDGSGNPTDDFGEQYGELGNSLCNGCPDSFNTDLVIMWQAILVADGKLALSQIDGQFGPVTASATRAWQTRWGIGVDGEVGNQTWSKADNGLYLYTGITGRQFVIYNGDGSGEVVFYRGNENIPNDGGAYQLYSITTPQDGLSHSFFGGPRIRFNALTVSPPLG